MEPEVIADLAAAKAAGVSYREYIIRKGQAARQRCMAPSNAFKQDRTERRTEPVKALPPLPPLPTPVDPLVALQCRNADLQKTIQKLKAEYRQNYLPRYQDWLNRQGDEDRKISMSMILHQTCERWGVTLADIRGTSRIRHITLARMEFSYRARTEAGAGWNAMGRVVRKDHTTCLHGYLTYGKYMQMKAEGKMPAGAALKKYWHLILEEQ